MLRFYADEDFPLPVVEALRQMGHDVITAYESGKANQSIADDEVLTFATAQTRALLTMNRRDFIRLHRERPDHGGILVCRFDPDCPALARRIHAAVDPLSSLSGQLLRINRPAQSG